MTERRLTSKKQIWKASMSQPMLMYTTSRKKKRMALIPLEECRNSSAVGKY